MLMTSEFDIGKDTEDQIIRNGLKFQQKLAETFRISLEFFFGENKQNINRKKKKIIWIFDRKKTQEFQKKKEMVFYRKLENY